MVEKDDMVCANCRFRFEHDDIVGLRCAKNAPIGYAEEATGGILPVYRGVVVSKFFYCAEGEWTEDKVITLGDIDHKRREFYRHGEINFFKMMYLDEIGE